VKYFFRKVEEGLTNYSFDLDYNAEQDDSISGQVLGVDHESCLGTDGVVGGVFNLLGLVKKHALQTGL
jgi:hypothetical protein